MGSKKAAIAACLLVLALLAVIAYTFFVPVVISRHYLNEMHTATRSLESSFQALNESTEFPIIANQNISEKNKKDNAQQISQLITTTRQRLAILKTTSRSLKVMPYSDFFGQYRDAQLMENRTKSLIGQTEDAINNYLLLITYLEDFNEAVDNVVLELNDFNSVTDINTYSNQSDRMLETAGKIRTNVTVLSQPNYPPNDMEDLNAAAIVALNEAASGFDDLAYGLWVPADDPIYAAASRIEKATVQLDTVRGVVYDDSLAQARAIKNIQDLNEKLELVLGTHDLFIPLWKEWFPAWAAQ